MKSITVIVLTFMAVLNIFSQTDNVPGNLINEYYSFRKIEDSQRKTAISLEMEKYMNTSYLTDNITNGRLIVDTRPGICTGSDWYNNDILVHSGNINDLTPRSLIIKQGEDGLLYMLAGLKPFASYLGSIRILKSSDGGVNWTQISQSYSTTDYIFSMDMLVESKDNNTPDSTRIMVYYTSSPNVNGNDAKLNLFSLRRNGTGFYYGVAGSPAAGRKFEQVTCCSDGQYYETNTYMHVFVKESPNAGQTNGFRHFRTVNWGATHTNELIVTDQRDNYPTAQFFSTAVTDSILISFERKFDASSTGYGIYKTTELPTIVNSYMMTPALESGVKNEKPCLAVSQQKYNIDKKMIITYTAGGKPVSYHSTNNGKSWIYRPMTSNNQSCAYTFCTSDSSSAAGNNFGAGFVTLNGDSVLSSKTTAGTSFTSSKLNNTSSSPVFSPSFCLYNNNGSKSVAAVFAGNSGINAYFDAEHLITGIQTISYEIPSGFSLEQNYPNPFNPVTNIRFSIPKSGVVTLKVFDVSGREVAQLINENLNAGSYNYDFNASYLSSGVYFYRISSEGFSDVKKMILVK